MTNFQPTNPIQWSGIAKKHRIESISNLNVAIVTFLNTPYQWDFSKISVEPKSEIKAKRKGAFETPRKDRIRAERERAREYVKSQLESIKDIAERIAVIQLLRTKDDPRDRQRILQCLVNDKFPQQPCICNYGKAGRSKKYCNCTTINPAA